MRRFCDFMCPLLGLLLSLGLVDPAHAQTPSCPPPTAVATEAAKSAFRAGQAAFNEGDYARAVELWQLAYIKDCTAHALLLNLATAQELAGKPGDAITSLELFNERMPGSSYIEPNRRRIERLRESLTPAPLAVPAAAPVAPVSAPPVAPSATEAPREGPSEPAPATLQHELVVAPAASDPFVHTPAGESTERSLLPLGVAAVGAAAGIVGGLVYANALVAVGSASDRCGGSRAACSDARAVADGEGARARAETAGWVTGIGVVTAVGGVAWYFMQPAPQQPEQQARGWSWDGALTHELGYVRATRRF
jgi:hypothetical protein